MGGVGGGGARHAEHQRRFGEQPLERSTVVEVGTGFVPLLPVGLFLAGAAAVHTYDVARLSNTARTLDLLHQIVASADSGALERECPWTLPDRLARLREIAADPPPGLDPLLAAMSITYHVGDATRSGLDARSVELFVTNNVFEHVPAGVISALLAEAHRTGVPGALLSHHIDLRDHYAKFDRTVSVYNSLRFSSRQWRLLNSRMEPQNRLRHSDYLRLVAEAGFDLLLDDSRTGPDAAFAAGDLETIIASIESRLLPLPPETQVLPGHGDITTIEASRRGVSAYRLSPRPAGYFGDVAWPAT